MSFSPNTIPILQTYSILAAALAGGTNLSTTLVTLPPLLLSPSSLLAKQWKSLYDHGILPVVTLAFSSSAGFSILAYRSHITPAITPVGISHVQRNLYVVAALGTLSLAPFTKLLMAGTIDELAERAEKKDGEKGGERAAGASTHELVKRWGVLNFRRGLILLGAAVAGSWASLT